MLDRLREEFLYPDSEFTPIPFWFWNDRLNKEEIVRQIHDFKDKGVDGFVIHPRIGIPEDIGYLSEEFLDLVEWAVKEADNLGMKVVLYDEGMYPSGSAHGMVVGSNPQYACRGLKMVEHEWNDKVEIPIVLQGDETLVAILAARKIDQSSIEPKSVKIIEPIGGKVYLQAPEGDNWAVFLFVETYTKGSIRGIHFGEDDGEPNAPPAADLLNPEAMQKFIELTHERYYKALEPYFGKTIIGMFTDEPDIMGRGAIQGLVPWTPGFLDWYLDHGNEIKDLLALWFDMGSGTGIKRKNYRKAVYKRLEMAYYQPISSWCEQHGIALAGHPGGSDDIGLLKHFHIPGQDVVWRWVAPEDGKALEGVHSTQGKCSSDAARHMGRRRNSNECFGCCGPDGIHWGFTVDDMKWYMDWLFVRGVNLLYPHAFYYSIRGQRFEERPPDVGPNNLWWPNYKYISTYIKRMSWLMTDIVNVTSIAVLCEEDHLPWAIVKPLFENQIEFNYLQEDLFIQDNTTIKDGYIHINLQRYKVLVVEDCNLISNSNRAKIQGFIDQGGFVVLYNPCNRYVALTGAVEIKETDDIVKALDSLITRDVRFSGISKDIRITHVLKEGIHFYLLVNEGENLLSCNMTIDVIGAAEQWDAWEGLTAPANIQRIGKEDMDIFIRLERRQSLIIAVDPQQEAKLNLYEPIEEVKVVLNIEKGWKIINPPKTIESKFQLRSWTEYEGLEDFSGTLIYENKFSLDRPWDLDESIYLDLGEVHNLALLKINGKEAGIKMWAPYIFDITDFVHAGENIIEVEITNTLANRLSKAKLTSGLIGPVRLYIIS